MVTYSPFLTLVDPAVATNQRVLQVMAYHENEYAWLGGRERAFDGRLHTSEHDPKWSATATIQFMTGAEVESFETFIAAETDPTRKRPTALRELILLHFGSNGNMQRQVGIRVYVHITGKDPFQYITGSVLTTGWTLDILLEESQ